MYSKDVLIIVAAIMVGDYSAISDNEMDTINTNVQKLKELYENMISSEYKNTQEFRTACVELFEYYKKEREVLMILFIRELTLNNVFMSFKFVPEFEEIVDSNKELIIQAKNYH